MQTEPFTCVECDEPKPLYRSGMCRDCFDSLAEERERVRTVERCALIAEEVAAEVSDGEGEFYIARKIADRIRSMVPKP